MSKEKESPNRVINARYEGELRLSDSADPLTVAVLEDGTRLISRNAIFRAFGRTKRGRAIAENRAENLPSFADAKNLQPFIGDELYDILTTPIKCKTIAGPIIDGYRAEILPLLCDAYLEADKNGKLTASQKPLSEASLIIVRSLSKIGIIALIDEATGYQYDRESDELQKILRAYISEELLPWQKKFPDVFYKELFRLNGWDFTVRGIKKRPGVIGKWTKTLIYNELPKGVLEELEMKTPINKRGKKKTQMHRLLTEDIGNPHLTAQINQMITLFQLSDNMEHMWQQFEKLKHRQSGQLELPFNFDEKGHTIEPIEESTLFDFNKNLKKGLDWNPKEN